MTAARLWWVRHGPTHIKRVVGWSDVAADLSDTAMIEALDGDLPPGVPVVSSDLLRARQTAQAIGGKRPRLAALADLREMHFGDWEDLTPDQISDRHPEISRRFWTGEADLKAPGGESWNDLSARVDRAEEALLAQGGDVIVVAHMGVIMTRIHKAMRGTVHDAMGHRIAPLSITLTQHDAEGPKLIYAGRLPGTVNTS